ncbi:MAG: hypothetical protein AAB855_00985, partial [Patescibacteria group bacterium]
DSLVVAPRGSPTSFTSPPLGELAGRPSRFRLLSEHRIGLRFPTQHKQLCCCMNKKITPPKVGEVIF